MSPPKHSAPPTHPAPPPGPHTRRADLASRAWTEALAMTRPDPDPDPDPDSGPDPGPGRAPRPCGELAAAALREHSALSAALGRSVPLTALGPGGGTGALAAFLAVYAAQDESRTASARRREP